MAKLDAHVTSAGADEPLLATNQNEDHSQTLTDLEAKILLLIAAGKPNAEIAVAVERDQAVVKRHIRSILRKAMASSGQGYRPMRIGLCPSELSSKIVSPFIA